MRPSRTRSEPAAAGRVEGHVHRLAEVRFRGDELNLEAVGEMKLQALLLGRERFGRAHAFGEKLRRGRGRKRASNCEGEQGKEREEAVLHAMRVLWRSRCGAERKSCSPDKRARNLPIFGLAKLTVEEAFSLRISQPISTYGTMGTKSAKS
jgi:hypothetical protein